MCAGRSYVMETRFLENMFIFKNILTVILNGCVSNVTQKLDYTKQQIPSNAFRKWVVEHDLINKLKTLYDCIYPS